MDRHSPFVSATLASKISIVRTTIISLSGLAVNVLILVKNPKYRPIVLGLLWTISIVFSSGILSIWGESWRPSKTTTMRIVFIEESLASHPRVEPVKIALPPLLLKEYAWQQHCCGLFQTPMAA